MILEHKKEFVDAFGAGAGSTYWPTGKGLCADKAGHVWLLQERQYLRVLITDKWEQVPMPNGMGGASGITAVGDGSKVYIGAQPGMGAGGALLEVVEGKVVATPVAVSGFGGNGLAVGVRDGQGGIWIGGTAPAKDNKPAAPAVMRLTEQGIVEQFPSSGSPIFRDKAGNFWLTASAMSSPLYTASVYEVCDKMAAGQSVTVPWASAMTPLVSDKPGSVYLWTVAGLQHLVAEDPAAPSKYTLKETVFPVGDPLPIFVYNSSTNQIAYSDLGFIVAANCQNRIDGKTYLYLIPMAK